MDAVSWRERRDIAKTFQLRLPRELDNVTRRNGPGDFVVAFQICRCTLLTVTGQSRRNLSVNTVVQRYFKVCNCCGFQRSPPAPFAARIRMYAGTELYKEMVVF